MPRRSAPAKGNLGTTIERAIRNLQLTPQQVAAAARIDKGTLSRILNGETLRPHLSTLRRICKVLQLDFATVAEVEQLELLVEVYEESGVLTEIESLLLAELRVVEPHDLHQAADLALWAMVDVKLGMGRGPGPCYFGLSGKEPPKVVQEMVLRQVREIPAAVRPAAVRAALGALTDFRIFQSAAPARDAYRRITSLQRTLWAVLRNREQRRPRTSRDL